MTDPLSRGQRHAPAHQHMQVSARTDGAETFIDPVCGMKVAAAASRRFGYRGTLYRFWSDRCLEKFRADPARYVPAETGKRVRRMPQRLLRKGRSTPAPCIRKFGSRTRETAPSAAWRSSR